ncbi:hypothetical protein BJS_02189 [Bradyrhizobium japonicum SEMIA 5079]|nr:hypothetical protein BJS_02189 [Bradyrhizobium japonicum SEMIA 5079]
MGYVNRSALIEGEQSMAAQSMTASNQSRTEQPVAKPDDTHCTPMTNQNSGSHGYEMYPQQFVRLVGCHDASLEALRKREDEKLH